MACRAPAASRRLVCLSSIAILGACGLLFAQAPAPQPATPCGTLYNRLVALTRLDLPEWKFHSDAAVPDGAALSLPTADWQVLKLGEAWPGGGAWFRASVQIPAALHGYDLTDSRVRARFRVDVGNEGVYNLWVDGVPIGGVQQQANVVIFEHARPGSHVFAVHAYGWPEHPRLQEARLDFDPPPGRPNPREVGESCRSAELIVDREGGVAGIPRREALTRAVAAVDWAALDRGDQKAFDASLRASHDVLASLDPWLKTMSVRATANSHIDLAWLWTWTETVEVVRNTFRDVLEYMRGFPDMIFSHSSVQTYAWMEEKYPRIFDEIRERVRERRWEVVGGMWVEPDLNMPDGESLVRQLLQGTRYDKQRFGVDVRVGWNPDSFGYSWQLPQIYKKSGLDYFVTQKMAWNDTTKFPYELFWWEAPDGSRLLTYFPHDYTNFTEPIKMAGDLADFAASSGRTELLHLYGIGDHGGGPMRAMLDNAKRWQQPGVVFPRLFFGRADGFFAEVERQRMPEIPTWKDELYLEYHRGVYTSQASTKQNNRRSEELLLNAEKFATLARGTSYPQAELTDAWRAVLFNQVHDVLSGSSINAVYRDADRSYAKVRRVTTDLISDSLRRIAQSVRTSGGGVPVVVFNPLSWNRTDVVDVAVELPRAGGAVDVVDSNGRRVLADVTGKEGGGRGVRIRFVAEDVPSIGYCVFHVVPATSLGILVKPDPAAQRQRASGSRSATPATARGTTLENAFLRVQIDAASGCLTSVFDKKDDREALAPGACGNLLQAFVDRPKEWDAWNIDADYEKQETDLREADEVTVVDAGPVRAAIRVRRRFQQSTFTQQITLDAGSPRLDIVSDINWHEHHILLKAAFPVVAQSSSATYEIPYGTIARPTTRKTPAERAKFEVPALRWSDLSSESFGVSLLSDSKYGYDTRDNVMRLSLLRGPTWPDPDCDQGAHHFTYSLYPHEGGWREAETIRRGYELNYKLIPVVASAHDGSLPASQSLITIEPANVVITAIKKAEDDDSTIVRFYEWSGRPADVRLHFAGGITEASETNLMEKPAGKLTIDNDAIVVPTRPYEIKTVKVRLR